MPDYISTRGVHHVTLTVSDVERAREFYTAVLGFKLAGEFGPRVLLSNGGMILALGPALDPTRAAAGDRFDENRVGLDHLSLSVDTRDELEQALRTLDERGIPHGEIVDLTDLQIYVLMLRDPDNIQLELTVPHS